MIDKWHLILSFLLILSIAVNGYMFGLVNSDDNIKEVYKTSLSNQLEINKRLVDSLSVANRDVTTTVQGNQRNKSKGK